MAESRWPTARSLAALALALALAAAPAAPAAAQTRFAWPDTTVDVSEYVTIDQCLSAVDRVTSGLARREALTVWRDTMPSDPREPLEPAPALVTETARRCAARFPEATAKLDDFLPLLHLYLVAGRDADASALVARRLAAVPAKDVRERIAVGDTAVKEYLEAHPMRLDAAEELLVTRARGGDRIDRLDLYNRLMGAAMQAGDTTRARRAAQRLIAVADSLTPAERESDKFERLGEGGGGKFIIYGAVQVATGLRTLLDSLRSGTASFVGLQRNMWAAIMRERPEALPIPIGERAPVIEAQHWIPAEAGRTQRPRAGHVSLLLFVDDADCLPWNFMGDVRDRCGLSLAQLRRLSRQFPALELTIIVRTHGSFVYAPPATPTEETDMIRGWLEPYQIPNLVVAVDSTPFWNLPRPDGRRIDEPTQNYTNYTFGKSWKPWSNAILVDQDGIIVSALGHVEQNLRQYIDVLMTRGSRRGEHAEK